jgi:hypothetical protein
MGYPRCIPQILHIPWGKQNLRISDAYGPQPDRVFGAFQAISLASNTFIGIGSRNLLDSKLHSIEISIVPHWQLVKRELKERQKFDSVKELFLSGFNGGFAGL